MPRRAHEPHTPHPARRGPDRHSRGIHLPRQAPVVERLRSMRPELDRGPGHRRIPSRPRSTVVSVAQVRLPGGVRVGNFPQNMQRRLRGEAPGLHHRIQRDLQCPPRPQSPRVSPPGKLIGNLIAQHQRRFQRRRLIRTGDELDHDNPFHFALNTFDGRGAFTAPMPTRCHQIMTEGSDKSGVPSPNSTATPSRALRWEFPYANNCGATTSGRRILRRAASGARCRSLPQALPSETTRLANHTHPPPSRSGPAPQISFFTGLDGRYSADSSFGLEHARVVQGP